MPSQPGEGCCNLLQETEKTELGFGCRERGCGRHLRTGFGEGAGILGQNEGLNEAGEGTVASCLRSLGTHLLTPKLSILGFPHRPLHELRRNKKMEPDDQQGLGLWGGLGVPSSVLSPCHWVSRQPPLVGAGPWAGFPELQEHQTWSCHPRTLTPFVSLVPAPDRQLSV